jgi:diguanylate cyclase (GGDEF)-like protein
MSSRQNSEAEAPPPEWIARFVEEIPNGVAVFDRQLRYVAANAHWISTFQIADAGVAGLRHDELDPHRGPQLVDLQQRALAGEVVNAASVGGDEGDLPFHAVSVRPRRGCDGAVFGVIAALHELAANERKTPDAPDRLTGLAGRHQFLARLRAVLPADEASDKASDSGTALFLLDIGDFKGVNDLYGARVGDAVLKAVAARLLTLTRSRAGVVGRDAGEPAAAGDLVARLGADEFAIVLGRAGQAVAETFAHDLLALVETPVVVGDQRIRLAANVGFITTGRAHCSEDDVLRDLNVALQEAKAHGPNSIRAWEPSLANTAGRRLVLLDQLRRALDEGEFVLHYQPIFSFADDRIVGAEALLRWNHPSDGLVSPADFLPALEESGLIVPVGCWVIREVVRQMQVWRMLYGRDMLEWVAINVSARQFNDPTLLLATLSEINDSGFPLDRLKLELTESAVMRKPEVARAVLGELQELGIGVALDDFGTGYSALGALRHYTVDTIKIDRDFTNRLDTEDGRELVLALLKIARIYGATVVAEGVETVMQRDLLRRAGCDFGQGYLFARPMDGGFFGAYALTHLVEDAAIG